MGYAIWLYWENYYGDRLPDYLELTLETIRRHAGDAPVRVVSPENLGEYVDLSTLPSGYDALIPAHKADYLRVRLLHDFGGMWIDIDTVVFKSLEENFLKHLNDHELVTLSSNFNQQVFASRSDGAFLKHCLGIISDCIENSSPLGWSAIGSEVLYPAAEKFPMHHVLMEGWAHGWEDWKKFLRPGSMAYENRLCCVLYNKMMFKKLKGKSRRAILNANTQLGSMLRHALDLETRDPAGGMRLNQRIRDFLSNLRL
jgi:hypothetical protein